MSYEKGIQICENNHTRIVYLGNDAGCPLCCIMKKLEEELSNNISKQRVKEAIDKIRIELINHEDLDWQNTHKKEYTAYHWIERIEEELGLE